MRKIALAAAAILLAALALASTAAAQAPLTVYGSMPLQGAGGSQARAVFQGARLALREAGGQAAGRPVRFVELDSSTAQVGTWTPEMVSRNARRAAQDSTAVAYLGEFNSGASAITVPITNASRLLVVSPSNTAVGLTTGGAGAERGEPEKYYPAGGPNYGRVIPNDHVGGRALAAIAQGAGAKRVLVISDGEVYGSGLARDAAASAGARGMEVTLRRLRYGARDNRRALVRAAKRFDAVIYGGITANGAVPLWNALHRAKRSLHLIGGEGVAESGFAKRITRRARARTLLAVSTLPAQAMAPAAQPVAQALGGNPDPYALYGYEAMALILDAVTRGGGTRAGAVQAFFATKDRQSILGTYSIDPNGDTTLTQYGRYRVVGGGAIQFDAAVDAGP